MRDDHTMTLRISGAAENNLKKISLTIPHNMIVCVTGVSGSGKSSLAFDVIYAESRYRFLENLSGHSRQFFSKLKRPDIEAISGLRPAVAVDQKTLASGVRSTVGTLSGIYDYYRLLFARCGTSEMEGLRLSRGLFSFNTAAGACPHCKGTGLHDYIDPDLLIADASCSLRQGALAITTPTGYIIYSQVTMDVMNQVCNAEGFHVDIPWKDLTEEQKNIVWYGSEKIKIPFGKHTLESRMKWKGITAKPREEGYYRGILPIMEEILKRDRNDNILRFARTESCPECNGTRLSREARSVLWKGRSIAELSELTMDEADKWFRNTDESDPVAAEVAAAVCERTGLLRSLGLGYLTCSRSSESLSGGEAQRLRLCTQATSPLQGLIYVLDEPTAGLHPYDTDRLMEVIRGLCSKGNTVIVVEHDEQVIRQSQWIVDIGPAAGHEGGELLFSGPLPEFLKNGPAVSPTRKWLTRPGAVPVNLPDSHETITISGLSRNNVINAEITLGLRSLNVITGVSGAGKSSLAEALEEKLRSMGTASPFSRVVSVDQKPIGKTSRSNPATYTGMFDHIRKLYGRLPEAVEAGLSPSSFSFNTGNGRCTNCEGAGSVSMGMHFMGQAEIPCEVCHGRRFQEHVLKVEYRGRNIYDVLSMRISDALEFFHEEKTIRKYLDVMNSLGLGYLFLGQTSTTLSGGEAQRIKLSAELSASAGKNMLYLFDEPTTGLHNEDITMLLGAFRKLMQSGHTILCIEHHRSLIMHAARVTDMGPGSGVEGGRVIFSGSPADLLNAKGSHTAGCLKDDHSLPAEESKSNALPELWFHRVNTNNLKGVSISIPHNKTTIITGLSGSGKTSLAFDTIYAECHQRYTENWSPYVRTQLPSLPKGDFESCGGITPALAVTQNPLSDNPRSTVGTYSGINDLLRLLFSRAVRVLYNEHVFSSVFSFNHTDGACPECRGLGEILSADPIKLISHPDRAIHEGAMDGTRTGTFYGDPKGQYMASVLSYAKLKGFDITRPWNQLGEDIQKFIMYGSEGEMFETEWNYARGQREGTYRFTKEWEGIVALVNEEYQRKHADHRGDQMQAVMTSLFCPACQGSRLNKTAVKWTVERKTIADVSGLSVSACMEWLKDMQQDVLLRALNSVIKALTEKLSALEGLSLGYIPLNRTTVSLSGGERQRLKLAGIIDSAFTGMTFVLDEPAVGLHPAERLPILQRLRQLQERGNTLLMVEHQMDFFAMADAVIETGPGAGARGGEILFSGRTDLFFKHRKEVQPVVIPALPEGLNYFQVTNASARTLKGIDVLFPAAAITSITGLSGAGKSTLLQEVIFASLEAGQARGCHSVNVPATCRPVFCNSLSAGRSSGGTVITYSGISDQVRKLFSALPMAVSSGYKPSHFSLHQPGGRCENCKGKGYLSVRMDFLPDVKMDCPDCRGARFAEPIRQVTYEGKSISDIYAMTLSELKEWMRCDPSRACRQVSEMAGLFEKAGLGHLVCGQEISDLSGGEWQRLQMVMAIASPGKGPAIFLLDEPASGLAESDIVVLGNLFNSLVSAGHTVVFTEHRPSLIRWSHWNIDLGPGGGEKGGRLMYCGPTKGLRDCGESLTARFI